MKDSRHDSSDGHVEPLLDRYRTGELEGPERVRVEAHLAECAGCAAALGELEAFAGTVMLGYTVERARAAGREPDWARQRQAILARTSARPARGGAGRLLRYAPQAAVAALALIAVGVLYEEGIRGPEDAERAVAPSKPAALRAPAPKRPATEGPDRANREFEPRSETVSKEGTAGFRARAAPPPAGAAVEGRLDRPAAVGGVYADKERAAGEAAEEEEKPVTKAAARGRLGDHAQEEVAGEPAAEDRREVDELRDAAPDRPAARNEAVGQEQAPPSEPADRDAAENLASTLDPHYRYEVQARAALASRDTAAARRSLSFWHDSLAAGADLESSRLAVGQALADSLAALLASRP